MTPEEKELYVNELAQKGYEKAAHVEALFDELALKSAMLKSETRKLKVELSDKLAEENPQP